MIFSAGGGSLAKNVSLNLISAIKVAKAKQLKIPDRVMLHYKL